MRAHRVLGAAILAAAALLPTPSSATVISTTYVSGVWDAGGSPYTVLCPIIVAAESQLAIEPGVEVVFEDPTYGLTVNGTLLAVGAPGDSILFTCDSPEHTSWAGIRFVEGSDASVLERCIVERARTLVTDGAGIRVLSCSPTIRESTIRLCSSGGDGGGIYLNNSAAQILGCTMARNEADWRGGGAMVEGAASSPHFDGCMFQGNRAQAGAGVHVEQCAAAVSRCRFTQNHALGYGGGLMSQGGAISVDGGDFDGNQADLGGGIWCQAGRGVIRNAVLRGNQGGGIGGDMVDPLLIQYCSLLSNVAARGGGVYVLQSSAMLDHATLHGNVAAGADGVTAGGFSSVVLTNSVFADDGSSLEILSECGSSVDISYCDVVGGQGQVETDAGTASWGEGNIPDDPLLCEQPPFLQDCSPCLGAGSGGTDMGAAGAGCPCGDPTGVPEVIEASWSAMKARYR